MVCLILMKTFTLFIPQKYVCPALNYKIIHRPRVLFEFLGPRSGPLPLHQPARLAAPPFKHFTIDLLHFLVATRQKLIVEIKVSLFRQYAQK
jgi:hypothetical protein